VTSVGLVGLGYWGPNLLRVLVDMEEVEVAYICDLDEERLGRFASRYPSAVTTPRLDDLLDDPDLDSVMIATPPATHHDLAQRALRAGKHTFVEKPLASTSEEAAELLAEADRRGVALMCGHTFLYSPPVRAVKELLEQGALGSIYFISSSRVNLGLHQRDISVVWDLGPHDFSILLYWLGEMPLSVRAIGRDSVVRGIPDVAFIDLTFPDEVLAHVELSWLSPSKLRRTVVVGSERMVVYEDGSMEPLRIFDHGVIYRDPQTFGEYHLSYRTGDIVSPKIDTAEPIALELAGFFALIRGEGSLPWEARLAYDVVRLIEAAETSMRQDGAQVALSDLRSRAAER
jgi:predicted dehydrogenase